MNETPASLEAEQPEITDDAALQIYAEQVGYLYHLSRLGYTGTLISAVIIGIALWDVGTRELLMGWLGMVLVVTLARYLLYRAFLNAAPAASSSRTWARYFVIGSGAMGIMWGALGTLLYPTQFIPHQFLVIFLIIGMVATAMIILAPLRAAFLVFVVPAMVPTIIMVFVQDTALHYFMGVLTLVFFGVMMGNSPVISGMIRESLRMKYENSKLIRRLSAAHAESEAINAQLNERVSLEQHTAEQLRQATQKFRALINASPLAIVVRDAQGLIERWNPAAERIFGWNEAEVQGRKVEWYPSGNEKEEGQHFRNIVFGGGVFADIEAVRRRKDGALITVSISGAPVYDLQGNVIGAMVMLADITERKRVALRQELQAEITKALAESRGIEEALLKVIQAMCGKMGWASGARWVLDRRNGTLHCEEAWGVDSPAVREFVAATRGMVNSQLMVQAGKPAGVVRRVWDIAAPVWVADVLEDPGFRRIDVARAAGLRTALGFPVMIGEEFYGVMEFFAPAVWPPDQELMQFAGQIGSQVGQFLARKQAEDNLHFVATHDALTALPNRTMFDDRFTHALAQAQRYNRQLALLFIDLDGFKVVNDRYGHGVGDVLLKEIAGRLRSRLREGDVIGRIGGDEFVVLVEELGAAGELAGVASKIIEVVALPVVVQGQECKVTASIGISIFPGDGRDAQSLLKNADTAMYRAKVQGKNCFQFYSI